MTERMDIVTPRQGNDGKTYWNRIGVAFATRDGGWALTFEALPLPTLRDGKLECRALLMPPKPRGGRNDGGDDVPF